jgi:hypothetical protein
MKDNKEIQVCDLCKPIATDIEKEVGNYRRDFEQIVKDQDCLLHYSCLPLIRLRAKQDELRKTA